MLAALRSDLKIELYERDPVLDTLRRIEPSEAANVSSYMVPTREAQALVARAGQELNGMLPARREAISFHPNVMDKEVVVRFRGLSFLRWHESGIFFGAREMHTKLQLGRENALGKVVEELQIYRNPLASDLRHSLYRAQAER